MKTNFSQNIFFSFLLEYVFTEVQLFTFISLLLRLYFFSFYSNNNKTQSWLKQQFAAAICQRSLIVLCGDWQVAAGRGIRPIECASDWLVLQRVCVCVCVCVWFVELAWCEIWCFRCIVPVAGNRNFYIVKNTQPCIEFQWVYIQSRTRPFSTKMRTTTSLVSDLDIEPEAATIAAIAEKNFRLAAAAEKKFG